MEVSVYDVAHTLSCLLKCRQILSPFRTWCRLRLMFIVIFHLRLLDHCFFLPKRTAGDLNSFLMCTMRCLTFEGPQLRACLAPPTCFYGPMTPVNSIDEVFFPLFLSDVPTHHYTPHARLQTTPPFAWHLWPAGLTGREIPVVAQFSPRRRDTHRFCALFLAPSSGVQEVA